MTGAELGATFIHPQIYADEYRIREGLGPGLTLRQHYFGLAMQGMLANPFFAQQANDGFSTGDFELVAKYHAGAMLDALARSQP